MFATAAKEPIIAHALGTLLQPHSGPVIVTVGIEAYYQELGIAISFDDLAERVRVRGEVRRCLCPSRCVSLVLVVLI